jgi:uncharacterized membrane protein YiaA
MTAIILWIAFTFLVGYYASSKGLRFFGWGFWIALILSPLVGALLTAIRRRQVRAKFVSDQPRAAFCLIWIAAIFAGILSVAPFIG